MLFALKSLNMLCFSLPEGGIGEWAIYMMGAYGIRPIFAWRGSLQISLRIENATFKNNAFWYKIELKIANLLIMAAYPHIKEWFPDVLTKYGKHCGMIIKRFSLIMTLYYFANDCFSSWRRKWHSARWIVTRNCNRATICVVWAYRE